MSKSRHETISHGIRKDHSLNCDRVRCSCPYSFWKPQENAGSRVRATVYGTFADARRAKEQETREAAERRRTRVNQRSGVTPMPTLNEWFDHLMQHEWSAVRISTQDRRMVDYNARLRDPLGPLRLNRLTPQVVKAWVYERIKEEGNRRCIQNAHDTLICMIAVAVKQRLLPVNTAKAVRYPVEGLVTKPHRVLTMEQYRRYLGVCRSRQERLIVRILCEAGLRRSEIVELQIGDLDLAQQLIHVNRRIYVTRDKRIDIDTPKGRRVRTVAINGSLAHELRWHLADMDDPSKTSYIFTRCNQYTRNRTRALSGSGLMKLIQYLGARAGFVDEGKTRSWLSPHILRKTGASIAVAKGMSPHIAQEQLGHAHLSTTQQHYLHLPIVEPLRQYAAVFE